MVLKIHFKNLIIIKMSSSNYQFITDFLMGGFSGAVAKTLCAPIERVKLLLQTGHTNHQLKVQYNGIVPFLIQDRLFH
jgi:hypothetical protein